MEERDKRKYQISKNSLKTAGIKLTEYTNPNTLTAAAALRAKRLTNMTPLEKTQEGYTNSEGMPPYTGPVRWKGGRRTRRRRRSTRRRR